MLFLNVNFGIQLLFMAILLHYDCDMSIFNSNIVGFIQRYDIARK